MLKEKLKKVERMWPEFSNFLVAKNPGLLPFMNVWRLFSGGARYSKGMEHFQKIATAQGRLDEAGTDIPMREVPGISTKEDDAFYSLKNLSALKVPVKWDESFVEQEHSFALHRFGWALLALAGGLMSKELCGQIIDDWLRQCRYRKGALGWDSYSISERVCNWCLIYHDFGKDNDFQQRLSSSIREQLNVLYVNLEFRGKSTNNHLLNNGRALYIGGLVIKEERFISAGKEIIEFCQHSLFYPSGMLREGSSHYQILVCRSFLEIVWFATQHSDQGFVRQTSSFAKRILDCACFFLGHHEFPYFGDVSPDFPVEFHSELTSVGNLLFNGQSQHPSLFQNGNKGWASFFTNLPAEISPRGGQCLPKISEGPNVLERPGKLERIEDAGFYRLTIGRMTFFFHVNPLSHVPSWSHGHSDIGHFLLYIDSRPAFIGTGRATYQDTELGRYGRSVRGHNSLRLEGKEPMIVHGLNGMVDFFDSGYLGRAPGLHIVHESEERCIFEIIFYTYSRWYKGCVVTRRFEVDKEGLTIEDRISCNSTGDEAQPQELHYLETFFHLPKQDYVQNERFSIDFGQFEFSYELCSYFHLKKYHGTDPGSSAGTFSPQYGKVIQCTTLVYEQFSRFPIKNTYKMQLKKF